MFDTLSNQELVKLTPDILWFTFKSYPTTLQRSLSHSSIVHSSVTLSLIGLRVVGYGATSSILSVSPVAPSNTPSACWN